MVLQIVLLIVATILHVVGLPLCSLIIHYLKRKDDLHKTGLDRVMIDAIWSVIYLNLSLHLGLLLYALPVEYSDGFVLAYAATVSLFRYNFLCATFVTISTKLMYMKLGKIMLETSDKKIYWYSVLVRFSLMVVAYSMNYLKPFADKPPIEFTTLSKDPQQYHDQSPVNFDTFGLGSFILILLWIAQAVFTEDQARKMVSEPQNNKITNRLVLSSGGLLILVGLIVRTVGILDVDQEIVVLTTSIGYIVTMTVLSVAIPSLVIFRNANMKIVFKSSVNNLLPIIYIPSFITMLRRIPTNQVYDLNV